MLFAVALVETAEPLRSTARLGLFAVTRRSPHWL
jgi:hypothetical protein